MSSRTLLLISDISEDQAFASHVAQAAGLTLKNVNDLAKAMEILSAEDSVVVLVDIPDEARFRALEEAIQNSVGLFSDKVNPNHFHFITDEPLDTTEFLIQSPVFGHYIVRRFGDVAASGGIYGRIIAASLKPRIFGLQSVLKPGTKIQTVKLTASNQKQSAVEAVKNYLVAAKFQNRMATIIANAVDEILMNSIFDAPVDELGKHVYSQTARTSVFKLEGKAAVEMHIAFDGVYLAITAVDQFGSLAKDKLLSHISKVYSDTEYKVRTNAAGAGIGLATVFRSGGSFLFASESHERTEVTVFFKKTDNYREFKEQFQFLSTQFYF